MLKVNLILFLIQILSIALIALFGLAFYDLSMVIYLSVIIYILSLIIVNYQKPNIINLSTFFLLGFGVLIYGKLFGYIISPSSYSLQKIFCLDFFIDVCLDVTESTNSLLFFSFSLAVFSLGYLSRSNKEWSVNLDSTRPSKLKFLIFISYILVLVKSMTSYSTIKNAIVSGYNVLYQNQSEAYQSPYLLAINSLLIAILAILFSQRKKHSYVMFHFRILFIIFVSISLLGILTGSRSTFISGLIMLVWYNFHDKKIPKLFYILLAFFGAIVLSTTNYLASLSGSRDFAANKSFISSISAILYDQGASFLITDAAIKINDFPFLGYIKTLLPGIQVLYPLFGIRHRYQFDWGSYMAYSYDPYLYNLGFGLGWSIWADFYLLAFKFLPLYVVIIFYWAKLLNNLDLTTSDFNKSLSFILIVFVFSLSRSSVSPVIFVAISYAFILFWIRAKIRL